MMLAILFWMVQLLALAAAVVPPLIYPHALVLLLAPAAVCAICSLLLAITRLVLLRLSTQTRRAAMAAKHKPLADGAVQPHSNIRTNLAAREPRLWVVDVAVLVNELQRNGAASVLRELHDPQSRRLLRSILLTTDESDFALVSYRQQRNANDTFTMDPSSLESAVAVAAEAGVQSLWLDAWCHKVEGEYDHFNFCSTLTNVVRNARLVVWLPRARPDSTPGYQFRLWCSFEAAVIAARGLPVLIAGAGPTLSQIWLRRLGTRMLLLPCLVPAMNELWHLTVLNTFFLVASCLCPPVAIMYLLALGTPKGFGPTASPELGRQMQLARNGSLVLDTMLRHAVQRPAHARDAPRLHPNPTLARRLLKHTLPWLLAYDRRDVLVVHAVLTAVVQSLPDHGAGAAAAERLPTSIRSHSNHSHASCDRWAACRHASGRIAAASAASRWVALANDLCSQYNDDRMRSDFQALAVSAYAAALLEPSAGDAVKGQSLRSWLQEKDLEPLAAFAPLEGLHELGWMTLHGASCTLRTPVGMLLSDPPPVRAHRWKLADLVPVTQHKRGRLEYVSVLLILACVLLAFGVSIGSAFAGLGARRLQYALAGLSVAVPGLSVVVLYWQAISFSWAFGRAPHLADPRSLAQPRGYQFLTSVGGRTIGAAIYSCLLLLLARAADPSFLERMSSGMSSSTESCKANLDSPQVVFPDGTISSCFFLHGIAIVHGVLSVVCCSQMAAAATFHMICRGIDGGAHYVFSPQSYHNSIVATEEWKDEGGGEAQAARPGCVPTTRVHDVQGARRGMPWRKRATTASQTAKDGASVSTYVV